VSVESPTPGKLIEFEGIDGSGKSTQARLLADKLGDELHSIFLTREPGGGSLKAREAIFALDRDEPNAPWKELVLFEIDRAIHTQIIADLIKDGKIVISDRGPASTLAYQGYDRGIDLDFIRLANDLATGGRKADLIFLFDIDPEIAQQRLALRKGEKTQFDMGTMESHRRMRSGFRLEAMNNPDRWVEIEASRPQEEISRQIETTVRRRLGL